MQERRHHKRYSVDIMTIRGGIPFADNVKILDISLSGVLLETDRRPDIGNRYILTMESEGSVLTVQGTVVRSTLNKINKDPKENIVPTYNAGLHFTKLSNGKIIEIAKFVNDHFLEDQKQKVRFAYMYKSDNPKLYMRFFVEDPKRISSHDPQTYYVIKNINIGGMLIESEQEIDIDQTLIMEITLPDKKVISFLGRVLSCIFSEDISSGMHEIGIGFIDISDENKATLNDYIFSIENR